MGRGIDESWGEEWGGAFEGGPTLTATADRRCSSWLLPAIRAPALQLPAIAKCINSDRRQSRIQTFSKNDQLFNKR